METGDKGLRENGDRRKRTEKKDGGRMEVKKEKHNGGNTGWVKCMGKWRRDRLTVRGIHGFNFQI